MNQRKKTPPPGVETEGRQGTNSAGSAALQGAPACDCTTHRTSGQGRIPLRIEAYLLRGHPNALSNEHLQNVTGLGSRQVTQAVQDARRRGVPVLSSSHPGGYYIAATEEEKERFLRSMGHRAKEIIATLRCLERTKVEGTNG